MTVSATKKGYEAVTQAGDETKGGQPQQAATSQVHSVLVHPVGGVVGLVNDLLKVCLEHSLEIDCQADCCRVRSLRDDWEELFPLPLRKSVFRAILARVAVLCNDHAPNSVSPYGGKGELSAAENPSVALRATFVNTTAEQRLELTSRVAG